MNKEGFIKQLAERTGLDENQASQVNDILEDSSLIGNKNKEKIIKGIVEKLGVGESQADEIYNASFSILKDSLAEKINPFKK